MIDAQTLLNPDYADVELRAYAYLSTQFSRGVRSPIDCLQPFVIQSIGAFANNQLNWADIRRFLKDTYRLNVPFYMLDRMQTSLLRAGALEKNDLTRALICKDARPSLADKDVDLTISDFDRLGDALNLYATGRGAAAPLTADNWSDLIIPFFQRRSPPKDKAAAKVKGILLSNPKSFDFTIIADFVMDQFVVKSPHYRTIEQVYHGVLVSDFLTQIESSGNKASFKGLGVFYDGPVILRLLGCSGKIMQEATSDLHETLRELGCRIYYFKHTYDEVLSSIEAIIKSYENNKNIFRETQEAIARREITISEIYKIRAELDLRLSANFGLVEHSAGYENRKNDDFQIDEQGFKDYLMRNGSWGHTGSQAPDRDVMSLALITRLRGNKQVRDVSKSSFVFVTHNTRLAVLAKDFMREENHLSEGSVWPFLTVGQMSTIAWVINETFQDEKHVSKELIANCYAAALPDEDFDRVLRETLSATDPTQTHEIYKNAFVVQSIRQVALSQTAGQSSLIRTLTTSEILAEAAIAREQAVNQARAEERSTVMKEIEDTRAASLNTKAADFSGKCATSILTMLFIVVSYLAARDYGLFGSETARPKWVAYILTAAAIYGALDLFGVVSAASVRAWLKQLIYRRVLKLQQTLA